MSSLTRSLEYCTVLGTKKLHIMAGKKIEGVGREEATQIFLDNLRRAIPLLETAGVVGLIEPINTWSVPGVQKVHEPVNLVRRKYLTIEHLTENIY